MRLLLLGLLAMALSTYVVKVNAITNLEFFELVKPYATDIEEEDEYVDTDDGVINLPGGPEDELDLEFLLAVLEQDMSTATALKLEEYSKMTTDKGVGWWRRRRRRQRHRRRKICSCQHDRCSCCLGHEFRINLIFKKYRFRLSACVLVVYVPGDSAFTFTITLNNRRVYHREISLRNPPGLCFRIPVIGLFAKICIEVYDINLAEKSMCIRIAGVLDLLIKKFRLVTLHLGCFHIPVMEHLKILEQMANNTEHMVASTLPSANGMPLEESLDFSIQALDVDNLNDMLLHLEEETDASEYIFENKQSMYTNIDEE